MSLLQRCKLFDRYIGIDYSGAETPTAGLKGLRVYAGDRSSAADEVLPPAGSRRHWTRRGVSEWLLERVREPQATLVGMDHGFSFPREYFEAHALPLDWPTLLDDFQRHWPTDADDTSVEMVRKGVRGDAAARNGDARWRRAAEKRTGAAKSVFHFDVSGSVAKSTHAGLPWLRRLRREAGERVHFWPFDGWAVPSGRSVVLEIYPSLWSGEVAPEDRSADQHDAYCVAEWLRRADGDGTLAAFLEPAMSPAEREAARFEGWILGAPTLTPRFEAALSHALRVHRRQCRKGSSVPYASHLLSVAGLVLEDGGDEDEAIAALLHDAVEDGEGPLERCRIAERFGERVARIVEDCSDTDQKPKPAWKERKQAYLAHLETVAPEVLRVSCADKLHNARTTLLDYRSHGENFWDRFNATGDETLAYYDRLVAVFTRREVGRLAEELARAVAEIKRLSGRASHGG